MCQESSSPTRRSFLSTSAAGADKVVELTGNSARQGPQHSPEGGTVAGWKKRPESRSPLGSVSSAKSELYPGKAKRA